MNRIITTSHLQQKIGEISHSIGSVTYIVTNRGSGKIVMLPYFDGCDEKIMDYMEDYEMAQNQKILQKRYKKSAQSGQGSLIV